MDTEGTIAMSQMGQHDPLVIGSVSGDNEMLGEPMKGTFGASGNNTHDLEPNPFERSFARTEERSGVKAKVENTIPEISVSFSTVPNEEVGPKAELASNGTTVSAANSSNGVGTIPAALVKANSFGLSALVQQGITPPVLTPGGSKRLPASSLLPPLPGVLSPDGGSFIGTPGLWSTLFPQTPNGIAALGGNNAANPGNGILPAVTNSHTSGSTSATMTTNTSSKNMPELTQTPSSLLDDMIATHDLPQKNPQLTATTNPQAYLNSVQQQQLYNMIMNAKKSGLTPNESFLRSGLTPGGTMLNQLAILNGFNQGLLANTNNENTTGTATTATTTTNTSTSDNTTTNNTAANVLFNDQTSILDDKINIGHSNGQVTPGLMSILQQTDPLKPDLLSAKQNPMPVIKPPVNHSNTGSNSTIAANTSAANNILINGNNNNDSNRDNVINNKRVSETGEINISSKRARRAIDRKVNGELEEKQETTRELKNNKFENAKPAPAPTKKKGPGRKRKTGMSEQEKRQNFLERNRVAASKCRERKKQMIEKIKSDLGGYEKENELLRNQVNQMKNYALNLRGVLFQHQHCGTLLNDVHGIGSLMQLINGESSNHDMISIESVPSFMDEIPRFVKSESEEEDRSDTD